MDRHHIFLGLVIVMILMAVACGGAEVVTTTAPAQPSGAEQGRFLSTSYGCTACHSNDGGAGVGPTWQGLFGKDEILSDGSIVKVDGAYLRESIVDPNATIVKGFPAGFMPQGFGSRLSEEQTQAIIEYIK